MFCILHVPHGRSFSQSFDHQRRAASQHFEKKNGNNLVFIIRYLENDRLVANILYN